MDRYTNVKNLSPRGVVRLAVVTLASILGPATVANAQIPPSLPAGVACSFELGITAVGNVQVNREFTDRNGNVVRLLSAGKGSALTFTNLSTGSALQIRPSESVKRTVINPDGTETVTITGHNVLILFPSDVPVGPSTIQYVGRLIYTVDPSTGVFTVEGSSGKQVDVCAALSP